MPSITQHHSANSTKLMIIGDHGTGKTGALASLVTAGYKLRILDLDNGLDILKSLLTDPSSTYAKEVQAKGINLEEAVQTITITEHMKVVNGKILPTKATVWTRTMNLLYKWQEKDLVDGKEVIVQDLGEPRTWDNKTVVVIDSLSRLSDAAMNFCQALNGQLGSDSSSKGYEMRTDIRLAQGQIKKFLELLYDEDFKPNVIVIAHIGFRVPEGQQAPADGTPNTFAKRGYPETVGAALSPKIGRFFNNMIQCITTGSGQSEKHKLTTDTWGGVSAKTSAPSRVKSTYDIANGLAEFFQDVRGA